MKYFYSLLLCLLLASRSWAAVAVDTADTAYSGGFDTVTLTYTVTGSNTLALCGAAVNAGNSSLSTVSFNAVPMTTIYGTEPFTNFYYSLSRLVGVSGTGVSVVLSGSDAGYLGLGCSTFTGVDPTTPLGTYATATGPDNITLTVPANGLAADFAGDHPGDCSAGLSPGAGQTTLYAECATDATNTSMRASYRTTSGDFTWDQYWIQIGVPINPVVAVSANRRAIVIQ